MFHDTPKSKRRYLKADIINAEFTDRDNISIDYRLNGKTDNFTFNLKTGEEQ